MSHCAALEYYISTPVLHVHQQTLVPAMMNFGPAHPAAHGVLRMMLWMDVVQRVVLTGSTLISRVLLTSGSGVTADTHYRTTLYRSSSTNRLTAVQTASQHVSCFLLPVHSSHQYRQHHLSTCRLSDVSVVGLSQSSSNMFSPYARIDEKCSVRRENPATYQLRP